MKAGKILSRQLDGKSNRLGRERTSNVVTDQKYTVVETVLNIPYIIINTSICQENAKKDGISRLHFQICKFNIYLCKLTYHVLREIILEKFSYSKSAK